MIIQTGLRTDIPAFYSKWFYNRIKEGYVLVRNPFMNKRVYRYSLKPEDVDLLVFCSKNPEPMLEGLESLSEYKQLWYFTITPYGKDIEPNLPDKKKLLEVFKDLSSRVSKERIILRYDPIFITSKYSISYHLRAFEKIIKELHSYTTTCVISFIDLYAKTRKNFPDVKEVSFIEQCFIAQKFVDIARRYNILIKSCAEREELSLYGIDTTGCMTIDILERAAGKKLDIKPQKSRSNCNCYLSNDIGAYNTCLHLCKYCYANYSEKLVRDNYRDHKNDSPLLVGELNPDDEIIIRS